VIKSQEKSGPRIPKPSDNFFFESIPSNTDLKPKHNEGFDPEPNEREQLEAEGCTVLEERITTSDGRTIIKPTGYTKVFPVSKIFCIITCNIYQIPVLSFITILT
jgi:hypothetical protein